MATKNGMILNRLAKDFSDEKKARELLESIRWPNGVACPHCGSMDVTKVIAKKEASKIRKGLYRCQDCRKNKTKNQFTVTVGTIFEDSHIRLSKWLLAITLMSASKKGVSAHQLHRMLGITYKTAWFMAHRIRYAMHQPRLRKLMGVIEADETYIGGKARGIGSGSIEGKVPVVALVRRGGDVRSFALTHVSSATLREVLSENVHPSSRLMTDELHAYKSIGKEFASHDTVTHSKLEYVRGEVTTNAVEGYFGLLKRGINGIYHHVSREHLHRYLSEFDFRYNRRKISDTERTISAIAGFEGKRLMYKDS